jgi:hypothetical protein
VFSGVVRGQAYIYALSTKARSLFFFGKSHQSKILYRPLPKVMIAVQRAMQPSANRSKKGRV